MLRRIGILIMALTAIIAFLYVPSGHTEEKDWEKTVTLPNGQVVLDMNGEWDAIYDNKDFGTNKDVVNITQEGNKFVGIKLIGNEFLPKGVATIRGELEENGFKSLYGYNIAHGWTLSKGQISNDGNTIVIETPIEAYGYTAVLTLTRK
jgi:hypothetical protein